MSQKIMTKYKISVIEYDPSGYYYPKYKTIQTVIAESLQEAKEEAIKRTPWRNNFGSGWSKRANIITSEDIVVEVQEDEYETKAKAWDKYKAHMESHIAGEINEEELVSDLKSDYFESGDRP